MKLKQAEIDADKGVHGVDKVFVVDLNIVDVVADGVTDHFGCWVGCEQIRDWEAGVVGEP